MNVVTKAAFFVIAGMGGTWVAYEATGIFSPPTAGSRLTQTREQTRGPAGAPAPAAPVVRQLSKEEVEEELKKAQEAMSKGGTTEELKEFRPTKPLPADLPVALPSDI